jgi:WD40 repeat protein
MLATGYHDSVVLFNVADPAHPVQLTALPAHPKPVPPQIFMTMRFSPDGRMLATTSGNSNGMTLWDVTDPAHPTERAVLPRQRIVPGPKYDVMTFTPDGATLATADPAGLVTLWNVSDPAHPVVTSIVDTAVTDGGLMGLRTSDLEVVISADGRTMVTVMNNVKASVWDIADRDRPKHVRDVIRDGAGPGIYRISPDGRAVVSAARPNLDTITVWAIG